MSSALSTLNTTTEVPLSKAPNPQLLPGRRSISCPLLRVCVHGVCEFTALCVCTLDGLNAEHKFRVWVTILSHMSRHFHFWIEYSFYRQKQRKLNVLIDLVITNTQLFTSQNIIDWLNHVDYSCQQLLGRHPFTVEDPLVNKWCYAEFLQICSDGETNSSTSWMAWEWVGKPLF